MTALALSVLLAVGFFLLLRYRLSRSGQVEWYKRWKNVDRERREQISRSVKQGEAVRDPDDAELALELISYMEQTGNAVPRLPRWLELAGLTVVTALFVAIDGANSLPFLAPLFAFYVLGILISFAARRRPDRLAEAKRLNEALLVEIGRSTGRESPESPRETLAPARRRAIRRTVLMGRAVADPRDAALAAELAARRELELSRRRGGRFARWTRRGLIALAVLTFLGALARADWIGLAIMAPYMVPGFGIAAFEGVRRLRLRNARRAKRLNEQLASGLGLWSAPATSLETVRSVPEPTPAQPTTTTRPSSIGKPAWRVARTTAASLISGLVAVFLSGYVTGIEDPAPALVWAIFLAGLAVGGTLSWRVRPRARS